MIPLRPSALIELRESPGRGRGVFALQDLPEGTIVEECPVIVVPEAECEALVKTALVDYYFGWGGTRDDAAIALGYGSLFNHSPHPNAMYVRKTDERTIFFVTVKSVAKDEEITVSYRGGFGDPGPVWFEAK